VKKKINQRFIGIAVFSIVITAFAMSMIFYAQLKRQVFSDLKVVAELLKEAILAGELSENREESVILSDRTAFFEQLPEDIRVTVIETDGTVCYDSMADAAGLENHMGRPEVREAFEKGFGQGVRKSDTLSQSVLYYALRMESGQILRVGKEAASVGWMVLSTLPVMLAVMLVLVIVCMAASYYLTAAIVEPIDTLVENMKHMEEANIYEELIPFTRKIRSQHEEILAAANIRQEFTANVTHELKTPLAAISGYAELMETGVAKEEDVRRFSHEIRRSATRLLNLINDILKLSKLDAGYQEELLEIVDLAVIARDTTEMLSLNAEKMDVSVSYQGCESAKIRIGRELAEEIVYNLVENAIRYNQKGGKVCVCVLNEGKNLLFRVTDTGIGIPKEHQERIFERFYRVDKSRSKELGGTGLGLAIVKHICELTGGRLKLESQVGKGTTVSVLWEQKAL